MNIHLLPVRGRYIYAVAFLLILMTGACDSNSLPGSENGDPQPLSSFEEDARALLDQMNLAEKIGQMTQADQEFIRDESDVAKYFLGSVLSGGNSDPKEGNSLQAWTDRYDQLQQLAMGTRLGIPLLYGIDAVHGNNNVIGAVVFPHNIGLGATRNANLVEQVARITAEEVRATGIQWTFAPAVSVPRDERWGRTYEGFSEDPELVSELGAAAVRGLQGAGLNDPLSVLACIKHYLGDGGTLPGTGVGLDGQGWDQGDMRLDEETMRRLHLFPYLASIEAGAGTVMPSYSSWNGQKMSANRYLLTDVLKEDLGFEGFLISDYNALDQIVPGDFKASIEQSINAGMDMVMVPQRYVEFIQLLTELVNEGKVPESRIDDAVLRILKVKLAMGLMVPDRSQLADRSLHASFGSDEHREVAREAVRQSIVMLKNEGNTLPLNVNATRIHVAGKGADDVGMQSGGWTIAWQGQTGNIIPGTTILEAVRIAASDDSEVTHSVDGEGAAGADVGIVVVGETPYAEMMGDRAELSLDAEDIQAVKNMKAAGIPVVVVVLSGRPVVLGEVLDLADALVAAWLPGTEGDGVTDVLFGDYAPTGKLSYSWPRSMDQLPINVGDEDYDPLFPYGYGLSY